MAFKELHFQSQARESLLRGAKTLTDAVRITLGPKSKCVLIQKAFGLPMVCNDGVTIAREVQLKEPGENLGAQMIRQAAERTGDAVGDGTSTATILAYAIFADGVRNVAAGASAIDLKHGVDRGVKAAVASLRAQSKPVQSRREKAQIAAISAHNDTAIGELVADAFERVGAEGVVSLEESKTTETQLEVVEGLASKISPANISSHPWRTPRCNHFSAKTRRASAPWKPRIRISKPKQVSLRNSPAVCGKRL